MIAAGAGTRNQHRIDRRNRALRKRRRILRVETRRTRHFASHACRPAEPPHQGHGDPSGHGRNRIFAGAFPAIKERADKTYTGVRPLTGARILRKRSPGSLQLPAYMNVNDMSTDAGSAGRCILHLPEYEITTLSVFEIRDRICRKNRSADTEIENYAADFQPAPKRLLPRSP